MFHPKKTAYFQRYFSYTEPLATIRKMKLVKEIIGKLKYSFVILSGIGLFIVFPIGLYLQNIENEKIDLNKKETIAIITKKTSRKWRKVEFTIEGNTIEKKIKVPSNANSYSKGQNIVVEYDSTNHENYRFVWK